MYSNGVKGSVKLYTSGHLYACSLVFKRGMNPVLLFKESRGTSLQCKVFWGFFCLFFFLHVRILYFEHMKSYCGF